MFIATDSPLPASALLVLRFQLGDEGICHEIEGRVIWANRPGSAGDRAPGMGVEFTDPAACAALARELEGIAPAAPTLRAKRRKRDES